MAFIRRVISEILDDLEGTEEISVKTPAASSEGEPGRVSGTPTSPPFEVAGVAASGSSDALALRMLAEILDPSKCTLVILEGAGSPMQLAERVAEKSPAMVILSHLPPEALAQARYQVRRLRRGSPGWRSWWGGGGRPAAIRRCRGSPESGPHTWPSRWPMPATRSWPGPLPRFP